MNEFSVRKAAFAGFGLLRERPKAVAMWWLVLFAYLAGIGALAAVMAGEAMQAMADLRDSGQFDMTSYGEISGEMNGYTAVSTVTQILVSVIITAAVLRAFLRPVDRGLAFMRLGGTELKLAVVVVVIGVLAWLAAGAVILLFGIVAAILAGTGSRAIGAAAIAVGVLLSVAVMVFLQLRLLLAAPQTVHDKAIRIFESWALTKGYFWRLFRAFLLMLLVLLPITVICLLGASLIGISMEGVSNPMELMVYVTSPAFTLAEAVSPPRLITVALMALLWVASSVLGLGMAANALEQIAGVSPVVSRFSDEDDDDDEDD